MQRRETKKYPQKKRVPTNIDRIRKMAAQSEPFFKKPVVKKITNTIIISGTIFGVLYISKYFLSATAKMIRSFKEVKDACKE